MSKKLLRQVRDELQSIRTNDIFVADAINAGRCVLGKARARDYWGNTIPSRDDVKQGTKGSYDFVADAMGADWADMMLEVA